MSLYDIYLEHRSCDKCDLHKLRTEKRADIAFGQGSNKAKGLLIIPHAIYDKVYTPYGEGTVEEEGIYRLWKAAGIDPAE